MGAKVFIVDSKYDADRKVYFVDSPYEEKNAVLISPGVLVQSKYDADVKVFIVDSQYDADVKIMRKNFPK